MLQEISCTFKREVGQDDQDVRRGYLLEMGVDPVLGHGLVFQGLAKIGEILQGQVRDLDLSKDVMVDLVEEVVEGPHVLFAALPLEVLGVRLDAVDEGRGQGLEGLMRAARRYSVKMVEVAP